MLGCPEVGAIQAGAGEELVLGLGELGVARRGLVGCVGDGVGEVGQVAGGDAP